MSPFLFDLIVIGLLLLSAIISFSRGFCNEIFTIFGWIGAVIATILLTPLSREFLRGHIHSKIIADLSTASLIFIVTMAVFSIISHYATKSLQDSKLSMVDRTLGFAFGLLRGVALLGLMFLLVVWISGGPDNEPEFVQKSHTRPVLEAAAHFMQFVLPGDNKIDIDGKNKDEPSKLDEVMKPQTADDAVTDFEKPETDSIDKKAPVAKDETKPADKPASPEKAP